MDGGSMEIQFSAPKLPEPEACRISYGLADPKAIMEEAVQLNMDRPSHKCRGIESRRKWAGNKHIVAVPHLAKS